MASPTLSIVAPAYNEERNIHAFLAAMIPVLEGIGETFEIIFVNDGSPDETVSVLKALTAKDDHVLAIEHSRNFGSQNAFTSGMKLATGDGCVLLDGDLQDPPELIEQFHAKWI